MDVESDEPHTQLSLRFGFAGAGGHTTPTDTCSRNNRDYEGGKSTFDDYVREVRPRFQVRRTFQRTIYRPGELVQCDLWEPRDLIPVGHGQQRRGYVVTAELCWSRVIAGSLIFSKEAPDILWGLGRCLERIVVLPEKLVWDREGAIAGHGRPTTEFVAFCGQLGVGWIILEAADPQAKGILERSHRFMRSNFVPGRRFANHLDFQDQLDRWCDRVNQRVHRTIRAVPAERLVEERARMRPLPSRLPDTDRRTVVRVPQQPYLRVDRNDYSRRPHVRRPAGRAARLPDPRDRHGAGHRGARRPAPSVLPGWVDVHRLAAPDPARAAAGPAPAAARGRRRDPTAVAL
jgi:hypothetical protein